MGVLPLTDVVPPFPSFEKNEKLRLGSDIAVEGDALF